MTCRDVGLIPMCTVLASQSLTAASDCDYMIFNFLKKISGQEGIMGLRVHHSMGWRFLVQKPGFDI